MGRLDCLHDATIYVLCSLLYVEHSVCYEPISVLVYIHMYIYIHMYVYIYIYIYMHAEMTILYKDFENEMK